MMPLRVAIPNSVMKPTSEPIESTRSVANTATTPPISASGRFAMTTSARDAEGNASCSTRKIAAITRMPSSMSVRLARSWLSN